MENGFAKLGLDVKIQWEHFIDTLSTDPMETEREQGDGDDQSSEPVQTT